MMSFMNFILLSALVISTFNEAGVHVLAHCDANHCGIAAHPVSSAIGLVTAEPNEGTSSASQETTTSSDSTTEIILVTASAGLLTVAPNEGTVSQSRESLTKNSLAPTESAKTKTIAIQTAAPNPGLNSQSIQTFPAASETTTETNTIALQTVATSQDAESFAKTKPVPLQTAATSQDTESFAKTKTIALQTAATSQGRVSDYPNGVAISSLKTSAPIIKTSSSSPFAGTRISVKPGPSIEASGSEVPAISQTPAQSQAFAITRAPSTSRPSAISQAPTISEPPTVPNRSQRASKFMSIKSAGEILNNPKASTVPQSPSNVVSSKHTGDKTLSSSTSAGHATSIHNRSQTLSGSSAMIFQSTQVSPIQTIDVKSSNQFSSVAPISASFPISVPSLSPTTLPSTLSTSNAASSLVSSAAAHETAKSSSTKPHVGLKQISMAFLASFVMSYLQ